MSPVLIQNLDVLVIRHTVEYFVSADALQLNEWLEDFKFVWRRNQYPDILENIVMGSRFHEEDVVESRRIESITIEGIYPPAIYISNVDGKTYAVSGGRPKEISPDIELKELIWINTMGEPPDTSGDYSTVVKSSSNGGEYQVEYKNGAWYCQCIGFSYRRRCTHIEVAKVMKG